MARSHLIDTRVALLIQSVRFANIDKVATHFRPLDAGVWDNRRERRSPLLGQGGVAAPSSKWSRSFGGAAGHERSECEPDRAKQGRVVGSTSDNRWLEPTTPSAPAAEASRHFLNGRSHPSLSKEGTSAFPSVVFNAPVSSKAAFVRQSRIIEEGPGSWQQNMVCFCRISARKRIEAGSSREPAEPSRWVLIPFG